MVPSLPIHVIYCSWSPYKKEEWAAMKDAFELASRPGLKLGNLFHLEFRNVPTTEPLRCNLVEMVRHKVFSAYQEVQLPCIVEHAGLILEGFEDKSFPGGLTQPMWGALEAKRFVACCAPLTLRAIARAVIGYCDGLCVKTFVGGTAGTLTDVPKGDRRFYWDTVFCPEGGGGATYSEIVRQHGLLEKLKYSQSVKALKSFMEFRLMTSPVLFPGL
jgi:XTP/dITP diphosphohydrolase